MFLLPNNNENFCRLNKQSKCEVHSKMEEAFQLEFNRNIAQRMLWIATWLLLHSIRI